MSLILLFAFNLHAADVCGEWLLKTNSKPGDPNCESSCASAMVDMGTFSCPSRCEKFCKAKPKCSADPFWTKAINSDSSPFKSLNDTDKERILKALSHLPKNFRPKSLKAIVKATQPDFMSPQNPASSSDEYIILFPKAFISNVPIDRILFHEVTHHLIYNEWAHDFLLYKKDAGWSKVDSRKGEFVEPDGRTSPEEDFANNIEYFIYDPEKLKKISPKIFEWIEKKMKSKLKLERGCNEENSTI